MAQHGKTGAEIIDNMEPITAELGCYPNCLEQKMTSLLLSLRNHSSINVYLRTTQQIRSDTASTITFDLIYSK